MARSTRPNAHHWQNDRYLPHDLHMARLARRAAIIDYAKRYSLRKAARHFGISHQRVVAILTRYGGTR